MTQSFFDRPILNSPYAFPERHWEIVDKQPTNRIIEARRRSDLISPVPESKKQRQRRGQPQMVFEDDLGLSSETQEYNPTPIID
jgi:type III restriction enzyme